MIRAQFFLLAVLAGAGTAAVPAPGYWTVRDGPAMSVPRAAHEATLMGAGQVLLTGGCSGPGCSPIEASAEILDTTTGRFVAVPPMRERRVSHVSARLPDGRVLVAGGWTGSASTASAEVFDPRSRKFLPAGAMATPRIDATATVLADGSVLVVGGSTATNRPVDTAERFEPGKDRFRTAARLSGPRVHHSATRLADGRVLVVGGMRTRSQALATAEIYDPASNTFQTTGAMARARCKHAAVLLKDGRVIVVAGSDDCDEQRRVATTEIYDPRTGRFSPGPALQNARYKIEGAVTVLASGEVVVAGNADDVEVWTPGQARFSQARGGIGSSLSFSAATALPDGGVLVTGGYDEVIRVTAGSWRVARAPSHASVAAPGR